VVVIRDHQIRWFYLVDDRYNELAVGADGIYHSLVFPGLRLDASAFLALDSLKVLDTLHQGLASPEHAAFVQRLQDDRGAN